MNNKVFKARVHWISKENGGRNSGIPYYNNQYGPIVSVNGERRVFGSEWSLLCCPYKKIDDENTFAFVRYLNTEKAPDNLMSGTIIELYEGHKKIAEGEILCSSSFIFETK